MSSSLFIWLLQCSTKLTAWNVLLSLVFFLYTAFVRPLFPFCFGPNWLVRTARLRPWEDALYILTLSVTMLTTFVFWTLYTLDFCLLDQRCGDPYVYHWARLNLTHTAPLVVTLANSHIVIPDLLTERYKLLHMRIAVCFVFGYFANLYICCCVLQLFDWPYPLMHFLDVNLWALLFLAAIGGLGTCVHVARAFACYMAGYEHEPHDSADRSHSD